MKTKPKNEIHILIVEDEAFDETSTRGFLVGAGYEKIETATNVEEAQAKLASGQLDFVILDLGIPEKEDEPSDQPYGLDLMDDVKVSKIPQIVLSQWATAQWVAPALERGISYLKKGDLREAALLDHAVQLVLTGGVVYSSTPLAIIQSLAVKTARRSDLSTLSHREKQVVYLYVFKFHGGERCDEKVAQVLVIQPDTAAKHRKNAMEKLNIHSAAELVSWANRNVPEFGDVKNIFKDVPESE